MKNKGILALTFVMATGILGIVGLMASASSSAAAPVTVGIDFNTADNTAMTVGAINTCLEVASGGSYTLDVYVGNVPGDTNPFTPDGMVASQYSLKCRTRRIAENPDDKMLSNGANTIQRTVDRAHRIAVRVESAQ